MQTAPMHKIGCHAALVQDPLNPDAPEVWQQLRSLCDRSTSGDMWKRRCQQHAQEVQALQCTVEQLQSRVAELEQLL